MVDDEFKAILSSYGPDAEVNSDSIGGVFELLYKSTSSPLPSFPTLQDRSRVALQPAILLLLLRI